MCCQSEYIAQACCVSVRQRASIHKIEVKTLQEAPEIPVYMPSDVQVIRLSRLELDAISDLNTEIFGDDRLLSRADHPDIVAFLLLSDGIRAGFKIGYGKANSVFYSARGGVLPVYRRRGYARRLLHEMLVAANALGYKTFRYDTFPKLYREMLLFGLREGFDVTDAGWHDPQKDFKLELSVSIPAYLNRLASDYPGALEETAEPDQNDGSIPGP